MTENDTSDDVDVRFVVGNETQKPLKLWLEAYCQFADLAPDQTVDFRASLLGDRRRSSTELAAAFQDIADKLRNAQTGPDLEIYLTEQKDGSLLLTLWVDKADTLEFG